MMDENKTTPDDANFTSVAKGTKTIWRIFKWDGHQQSKQHVVDIYETNEPLEEIAPKYLDTGQYLATLVDSEGAKVQSQFLNVNRSYSNQYDQNMLESLMREKEREDAENQQAFFNNKQQEEPPVEEEEEEEEEEEPDSLDEMEQEILRTQKIKNLMDIQNAQSQKERQPDGTMDMMKMFMMSQMRQNKPQESALEKTLAQLLPIVLPKMMEKPVQQESALEKTLAQLLPIVLPKIMEKPQVQESALEKTLSQLLPMVLPRMLEKPQPQQESGLEKTLAALLPVILPKMMEKPQVQETALEKTLATLLPVILPKLMEHKPSEIEKMMPVILGKMMEKPQESSWDKSLPSLISTITTMMSTFTTKNLDNEIKMKQKELEHKWGDPVLRKTQALNETVETIGQTVGNTVIGAIAAWKGAQQPTSTASAEATTTPPPAQPAAGQQQTPAPAQPAPQPAQQPKTSPGQPVFVDVVTMFLAGKQPQEISTFLKQKYPKELLVSLANDPLVIAEVIKRAGEPGKKLMDELKA